jgi:uncharacterized protein (DUF1684 family)
MADYLDLYDYRLRVAALYRERNSAMLAGEGAPPILQRFRAAKDQLFQTHSQSALDEQQKRAFKGLRYFPYNPDMRFIVEIDTAVEAARHEVTASEPLTMTTVGRVHFVVADRPVTLSIYWLDIYGGGLFLPFRDATSPDQSYGGGRYLFDTIKGSDFSPVPTTDGPQRIMLDFNYAYNPSCAYNDMWLCPLSPAENALHVRIPAGEKKYEDL